jgi:hypothetical protein
MRDGIVIGSGLRASIEPGFSQIDPLVVEEAAYIIL